MNAPMIHRWTPLLRLQLRSGLRSGVSLFVPCGLTAALPLAWAVLAGVMIGDTALYVAEALVPLLAATLAALALAPDFSVGADLLLGSTQAMRRRALFTQVLTAAGIAIVVSHAALGLVSLLGTGFNVIGLALLAFPSVFFVAAVTAAASWRFRSGPAGLALAAGIWALNLQLGYAVQPLLGLSGAAAHSDREVLGDLWVPGKLALVAAGAGLLLWEARRRAEYRQPSAWEAGRVSAWIAALLAAYVVSGALTGVGYLYWNRANVRGSVSGHLREHFGRYGRAPVTSLFGPAARLLANDAAPGGDTTGTRLADLEQGLRRWPRSIWADAMAMEALNLRKRSDRQSTLQAYLDYAGRYPGSPYAPRALEAAVKMEEPGSRVQYYGRSQRSIPVDPLRLEAARRLLEKYPRSRGAEMARALTERP